MYKTNVELKFPQDFVGQLTTARGEFPVGSESARLAPYDMLLAALGSCFYATFLDIVEKMQLSYEQADIKLEGINRDEVPTTLQSVTIDFTLKGANSEQRDKYERASDLAGKYCSIYQTVSHVADISVNLHLE